MDFILHLFQTIIIISIIILGVWLINTILGSTTGYRWRKILWFILAVRLIFPIPLYLSEHITSFKPIEVNIPLPDSATHADIDTILSVPSSIMNIQAGDLINDTDNAPGESIKDDSSVSIAPTNNDINSSISQNTGTDTNVGVNTDTQTPSFISVNTIIAYLFIVWAGGIIILAGIRLFQYRRLKSSYLKGTRLCEDSSLISKMNSLCNEFRIKNPICIVVQKNIKSPMLFGYFNTILLLPKISYSEAELDSILRHEITHYKKKDLWYKLLIMLACDLYWFNPIFRLMKRMAYRDVECICDDKATKHMYLDDKRVYCNSILRTMTGSRENNPEFTTRFAGNKKTAKQRLENILNSPNRKAGTVILSLLLVILLLGTVCISFNLSSGNKNLDNNGTIMSSNSNGSELSSKHNNTEASTNNNGTGAATDNNSTESATDENSTESSTDNNSAESSTNNNNGTSAFTNTETTTGSNSQNSTKEPTTNNNNIKTTEAAATNPSVIKMTMYSPIIDYAGDSVLTQLKKLHPNLEITSVSFDIEKHFLAAYKINGSTYELPTMFQQESGILIQAGKNNQVADLTDILNERGWLNQMKESVKLTVSDENGRIYGIPSNYSYALGILCNADMFRAAGLVDASGVPLVPQTWQELAESAVKIKESTGKAGFCLLAQDSAAGWHFISIANNFGAPSFCLYNGDGTFTANIDSKEAIEAMKFIKSLKWDYNVLTEDPTSESFSTGYQHIANGTAAMYISATDCLSIPTDYGIAPDKLAMAAMPAGPSGHKYTYYSGFAYAFSADATPEEIDVGLDLLELRGLGPVLNYQTQEQIQLHITGIKNEPVIASGIQIWKNKDILNYEQRILDQYGNTNQAFYQSYFDAADTPGNLKTDNTYNDYSSTLNEILRGVIQEVVTNPNANVEALMQSANEDFQWYINYHIYR